MPIITDPTPETTTPPTVYRICGLSMHNIAVPLRAELDEAGQPVTIVAGYMIVEYEAGDGNNGAFVRRAGGRVTIEGASFAAFLADPTGAAIAALLKLYLHQAMSDAGVFPAGQNAITPDEYRVIASFCGSYLGGLR